MKRYLSSLFIFSLILTSGCSVNTKINNNISIKQASKNLDSLINLNYKQVQNNIGYPTSSIYYINTKSLKNKNINSINIDDIKSSISALSSYHNKEDNTYLHLYFENSLVKKAVVGNYDLIYSSNLAPNSEIDYKLQFFNGQGNISSNNFSLIDIKNKFIRKNISEFNNYFKINKPNFLASKSNSNNKLYFYSLTSTKNKNDKYPEYNSNSNSKLGNINPTNNDINSYNKISNYDMSNYSKKLLVIYTKDNIIEYIQIADRSFMYDLINKAFEIKINHK